MTALLGRALAALALLGLTACGVSPERDPQPLPEPRPSPTAAPPACGGTCADAPPARLA